MGVAINVLETWETELAEIWRGSDFSSFKFAFVFFNRQLFFDQGPFRHFFVVKRLSKRIDVFCFIRTLRSQKWPREPFLITLFL